MMIYLGLSAVTAFVATWVLLLSGETTPLAAAHLVFAFGILPLIFGAVAYFVPVLTRGGRAHRGILLVPVFLQMAGISAFLYFDGDAGKAALHGAAGGALLLVLIFSFWLIVRARRTLGQPHPGWAWYLAALSMLAAALAAVLAMAVWPGAYRELRLLHLHLNTLGFVGLTALGTLQVLLPTALASPDAGAASRLRSDLWPCAGAVLALGVGASGGAGLGAGVALLMALAGALVLFFVGLRLGLGWVHRYGLPKLLGDGASVALAAALLGYLLLIGLGVLHAFQVLGGQNAVPAFVVLFLFPLVTGALTQLLPVWRWPGPRRPVREQMRSMLTRGGGLRALLFLMGGLGLALGIAEAYWLAAAGLLLFVVRLTNSFFPSAESAATDG